jgi:hypothetical protein
VAEVDEERARFIQAREQGVLYWKKKRFKVAKRSLLSAVKQPGGKRDFKTLYYLALVHHELLQFGPTLTYIDLAKMVESASPKRKETLTEIQTDIRENYGYVKLTKGPHNGPELGTFKLKPLTKFLNKKKRRYVDRLRAFHETRPIRLPKRLYLPYGAYNISGLHIDLNMKSSGSELAIFLDQSEEGAIPASPASPKAESDSNMWWVVGSVGATAIVGIATFLILSNSDAEPSSEFRISVRN